MKQKKVQSQMPNRPSRNDRSKHPDGARDKENDDTQRNKNLDHGQDFRPACQQRRIGRAEGGTLSERNKQIIDKARAPVRTGKLGPFVVRDLHLRKKETFAAKFLLVVTHGWSTAIQTPVPEGEDDHVREPEQSTRAQ